ncbi:MAG: beta-propeller fold lactonase family protein [Parachlamydiaceae bacterium]
MKKCHLFMLLCLAKNFVLSALVTSSPEPIAASSPLQSILHTWPREYLEYVENRTRLSTCTGVIWVGDNKLISIGAHNHSLDTYQFDPTIPSLFAYTNEDLNAFQETPVGQLENIVICKDSTLAAVANNGAASIQLYKILNGQFTHIAEIPKVGWWTHGVRFSRQMDYIAYTIFGDPGKIMLFRIIKNEDEIYITPSQDMDTDLFPLHPKGIDFSMDDRFVVVCHARNNSSAPNCLSAALAVYPFDRINGKIDPIPVSVIGTSELLSVPEDLCISPDGFSIFVTNHGNDTVTVHAFDPMTGQIGESRILLQNPEAQLSFPHGLSISPDGKYLAVTNYGDDTVKIYALSGSITNANF